MAPYNPNRRLREAAKSRDVVKSFVTLPQSHDPKVIVHFQRPMPCVIIMVHGVNDVGEAYRHQAAGLCAGLNDRLQRQDFNPGNWDVPQQCGTREEYTYARRTADQGRNPIIPFYWGYRPVDKATYDTDQKRYEAELKARGPAGAEAAYDAYLRDRSKDPGSGHENTDNFNNRLDKLFCKNGGVFANATTNLIDMWGPGSDIMGTARLVSNHAIPVVGNSGDYSHTIYQNPHRIYMINAAQRLADLIMAIRKNPQTANDSINIVAHSQGTLLTMLANFIVKNSELHLRPVDCVIFNHSPYSLVEPLLEGYQGKFALQQTEAARLTTLVNFCNVITTSKVAMPSLAEVDHDGIASLATLQKPGHARDNHGKVYNYFCPDEHTVSLKSVQGIGWQGIPTQWASQCGSGFKQRMFHHNAPVTGESVAIFPNVTLPFTSASVPKGETRNLNGEILPAPFIFKLPQNCKLMGSSDYGVDEAARGSAMIRTVIPDPRAHPPRRDGLSQGPMILMKMDTQEVQARLNAQGHDWTVLEAETQAPGMLTITRYQTKDEMRAETIGKAADDSFHSAIVNSEEASRFVTAYDLAIGRCKSYNFYKTDGGDFWQSLLKQADWRTSLEKDDFAYANRGILAEPVKTQMNKPPKIEGIKNETSAMSKEAIRKANLERHNTENKQELEKVFSDAAKQKETADQNAARHSSTD